MELVTKGTEEDWKEGTGDGQTSDLDALYSKCSDVTRVAKVEIFTRQKYRSGPPEGNVGWNHESAI